jgi:TRAP transporter 4TM/12TM fusion protein
MRERAVTALSLALGLFILYTSAFGTFDALVQRALFLALVIGLGVLIYPLGAGRRWRPAGIALDAVLVAVTLAACGYVIVHADRIMTSLPTAGPVEIGLTLALVLAILELSRRSIGLLFPVVVAAGIAYALLGQYIPGRLGHRGFDMYFIVETLLLGDLGIWGMLVGVAATVIAAFTLFGSFLLHTGGGQAFMDIALRASGRSIGGAAKIATVASGIFGMVSGSSVANVATTGSFTIPLMKRLRYPAALAGAVEAVASTGGQLAPPIMGAAAFIMAEIVGVDYVRIAAAATLPAVLFYLGVFFTVHVIARETGLGRVPESEVPAWRAVLRWNRLTPIVLAFGGLAFGIVSGRSIQTAAFFGIVGAVLGLIVNRAAAVLGKTAAPDAAGEGNARALGRPLMLALDDGGKGMVIVGILLAGAQILVAMINLTGIGVTLSSLIVGAGTGSLLFAGGIVAAVCMVMGMGIPTTAAYVLVAATLAPALIKLGAAPLTAHMFVFYYATLSVITPPVCVAVFVAAGIADAPWTAVARRAVSLGAVTYVIPFLFLLYPGMLAPQSALQFLDAAASGLIFVYAFSQLFGGAKLTGMRLIDGGLWSAIALMAVYPSVWVLAGAAILCVALAIARRRLRPAQVAQSG